MTAGKIKWTTGRVTQSASANPLVDILGINPPSAIRDVQHIQEDGFVLLYCVPLLSQTALYTST